MFTCVCFSLQALDYSDDEKEHEAKRRVKNVKRTRDSNSGGTDTRTRSHYVGL